MSAEDWWLVKPSATPWEKVISSAFVILLIILLSYSAYQLLTIYRAVAGTRFFTDAPPPLPLIPPGSEQTVTVQICAYNESQVVEKTIDAACRLDWPREKLFIQVLDDSTDEESSAIIKSITAKWRRASINCERLTRSDRVGYKAGNLAHHAESIVGDFVAVLDSDHRCEPQFLRQAMAYFYEDDLGSKPKIGLVQFPWAAYNTHRNLLTEYDALLTDYHHVIEQVARYHSFNFFSFNGTGGVWRTAAIEAGGGWKWDTLTEDMDLSIWSHLAGFDFVYARHFPQLLELPPNWKAHRQQKHRWTKGHQQVLRKTLRNALRSPDVTLLLKIELLFMMTKVIPLVVLLLTLLPVMNYLDCLTHLQHALLALCTIPICIGLVIAIFAKVPGSNGHYTTRLEKVKRLLRLPLVFILGIGMSIFEVNAMSEGLLSDDATFLTTPKDGKEKRKGSLDSAGPVALAQDEFHINLDSCSSESSDFSFPDEETPGTSSQDVELGEKYETQGGKEGRNKRLLCRDVCVTCLGFVLIAFLILLRVLEIQSFVSGQRTTILPFFVLFNIIGIVYTVGLFVVHGAALKYHAEQLFSKVCR